MIRRWQGIRRPGHLFDLRYRLNREPCGGRHPSGRVYSEYSYLPDQGAPQSLSGSLGWGFHESHERLVGVSPAYFNSVPQQMLHRPIVKTISTICAPQALQRAHRLAEPARILGPSDHGIESPAGALSQPLDPSGRGHDHVGDESARRRRRGEIEFKVVHDPRAGAHTHQDQREPEKARGQNDFHDPRIVPRPAVNNA